MAEHDPPARRVLLRRACDAERLLEGALRDELFGGVEGFHHFLPWIAVHGLHGLRTGFEPGPIDLIRANL